MAPTKRKRTELPTHGDAIGMLPPQAVELEEVVLGSMLLEKEAIISVIALLTAEAFYKEQNGRVFEAITRLYKKNQPADILTVTEELKRSGELEFVGGAFYVSSLTTRVASGANIEFHARILLQKFVARETIRTCTTTIRKAYDPAEDCFDLVQNHTNELEDVIGGVTRTDVASVGDIHVTAIFEMKDALEKNLPISGVRTGFRAVDQFTSGWQAGDLIIVAGRPGMGKTAFARACALRAAYEYGIPTAYFSLEVSKTQLTKGCQAYLTDISFSKLVKNQCNADELADVAARCANLFDTPLYIDDTPALSLLEFKTRATRLVKKKGVKQIYIDYMQLMSAGLDGKSNREQEIATISRTLKLIARQLEVPIIALSQLSRETERTGSKRPSLSHLRESGAIEQDADAVLFTFRPEYYDKDGFTEAAGTNVPNKGVFLLIFGKHRAGDVGDLLLGFQGTATKVVNYNLPMMQPEHTALEFFQDKKAEKPPEKLQEPPKNDTFVQPLGTNTDFLSQGPKEPAEKEDDPLSTPF